MRMMDLRIAVLVAVLVWIGPADLVAQNVEVQINEWEVPWGKTRPRDPYLRIQDEIWFVGQAGHYVGYFDTKTREFKRYDLDPGTGPHNVIVGEDGSIWYAGNRASHIGRLDADTGEITKFMMPNPEAVDPHTLTFNHDGDIWFTDPGYGALMNYEGTRIDTGSPQPIQKEAVYHIDGKTGKLTQVTDEIYKPNGLCFSPDYNKLYVADSGVSHYPDAKGEIKVWDVIDSSKLTKGRTFASMEMELNGETVSGIADGIRADVDGNIWSSAGWVGDGYDGVHVFAPDGDRIGQIILPEICSNVCFGGTKRNRLFMTGSTSLYSIYVETKGAHIT